jgi:hypothetical protein
MLCTDLTVIQLLPPYKMHVFRVTGGATWIAGGSAAGSGGAGILVTGGVGVS